MVKSTEQAEHMVLVEKPRNLLFWFLVFSLSIYGLVVSACLYTSTSFFDWDEWSILLGLSSNTFVDWLLQPHMGHLFPVGKFLYFFEIKTFGFEYKYYLLVNVLLHFSIVTLLYRLLRIMEGGALPSILIVILYCLHPAHYENLFWGMQSALLAGVVTLLLAFIKTAQYLKRSRKYDLVFLYALLLTSAYCFGFSLLSPVYCFSIVALSVIQGETNIGRVKSISLVLMLAQASIVLLWLTLPLLSNPVQLHPGAASKPDLSISIDSLWFSFLYIINGIFSSIVFFISNFTFKSDFGLTYISVLLTLVSIVFISLLYSQNRCQSLLSSLSVCVFILAPMIGLLSLTRYHALETIFQLRYYHYLGVPISLMVLLLIPGKKFNIPTKTIFTTALSLLYVSMIISGTEFLSNDWYRNTRGKEVASKLDLFNINKRNPDALWFPETNPELTNRQLHLIMSEID